MQHGCMVGCRRGSVEASFFGELKGLAVTLSSVTFPSTAAAGFLFWALVSFPSSFSLSFPFSFSLLPSFSFSFSFLLLALSPSPDSSWDNRLSSAPLILRLQETRISTCLVVSADLKVSTEDCKPVSRRCSSDRLAMARRAFPTTTVIFKRPCSKTSNDM